MKTIEVSVLVYPKNELVAVCKNCYTVIHRTSWTNYKDYKTKKKKFDSYKVCPYCAGAKKND